MDPLIGRLVDSRYRVRARIARGGMATVYVATDLRLERRVALKVMHGHLSDDMVFQSRFIQEARAAARLADPNVVNVFDQGQDGDMAYLVMEYLPGITLRDLLREQRRLTIAQTVTILDAILSGLSAAHRSGIIHRDIKPENVLLAEDGRIKIGDFGLARATTANTATGAQLLGTIAYLAPELVTRGSADARSDIYAIGIMLYEMLAGEQPYRGEQPMQIAFQHATDAVPTPSTRNAEVPEQLDDLVLWATQKSPDDRPNDAGEMLHRLREIERELGITPQLTRSSGASMNESDTGNLEERTRVLPPSSMTGPTSTIDDSDNAAALQHAAARRRTRGSWLVVVVLILTAIAGVTGWWFGSGPGSQVVVPSVAQATFDQAATTLSAETLTAVQEGEHSLTVAPDLVIRTDPAAGSRVDKDTSVTVFVSLGPAPVEVPSFADQPEGQVREALTALNLTVSDETLELFTASPRGNVVGVTLTPTSGAESISCTEGCSAFEGDAVALQVSVGPVPTVAGLSREDATKALTDQGLLVADTVVEESSEEVAKGDVIRMEPRPDGGSWRPGETVTLVVSNGPPLFPVPDVAGLSSNDAIAALEQAGFNPAYNVLLAPIPGTTATGTDPAAGTMLERGERVYIVLSITG